MDEFKRQGGGLTGREERSDAFAGEPKAVGGTLGGHGAHGTTSLTEQEGHHNTSRGANTGVGTSVNTGTGSHTDTTGKKPSLMDKLNPMKDADGDGKSGFMK